MTPKVSGGYEILCIEFTETPSKLRHVEPPDGSRGRGVDRCKSLCWQFFLPPRHLTPRANRFGIQPTPAVARIQSRGRTSRRGRLKFTLSSRGRRFSAPVSVCLQFPWVGCPGSRAGPAARQRNPDPPRRHSMGPHLLAQPFIKDPGSLNSMRFGPGCRQAERRHGRTFRLRGSLGTRLSAIGSLEMSR